jgi:hypothetical protein
VGVTVEATFGVTVRGLVAGEVPDDERLVAGSGQEHVRAARGLACCARNCEGGYGGERTSRGTSRGK